MVKAGPYWHVVRFEDHPLCPAKASPDVPKIIKHGISDDGPSHPKSPRISAADGVATVLHKMGRDDWLEKLLDWKGTKEFVLMVTMKPWSKFFVERHGRKAEVSALAFPPIQLLISGSSEDRLRSRRGQRNRRQLPNSRQRRLEAHQ